MESSLLIVEVLNQAFPALQPDPKWPPACWVANVKAGKPHTLQRLGSLRDAIKAVKKARQIPTLVSLLRQRHPLDRPHDKEFDREVLDVFNEACAFAWCLRKLGHAEFVQEEGKPDVRAGNVWLEAKNVHGSRNEADLIRQSLATDEPWVGDVPENAHDTFWKKFEDGLNDALKKFKRVDPKCVGGKIIYFNLELDLSVWPLANSIRADLSHWASEKEKTHKVQIVLTKGYEWRNPFYQSQSRADREA